MEKKVGREKLHPSSVKVPHGWTISATQQSLDRYINQKQDQTLNGNRENITHMTIHSLKEKGVDNQQNVSCLNAIL